MVICEKLAANNKITLANISKKKGLLKGYDVHHKIDEKAEEPGPEKQRKRKVKYQESAASHAAECCN